MSERAGRIAVVTGAAKGIGKACALRLAAEGLIIAAVDREEVAECVSEIAAAGGKARAYACDVTQPAEVTRTMERIVADLGGCDVLVNNAGRYDLTPHDSVSFETWRGIMALNVDGMFLFTQAAIPHMKSKGWGRIINLVSNSFLIGPAGLSGYVASKAANLGYVRALASELGQFGITVNAVGPGPTVTPGTSQMFYDAQGVFNQDQFDAFWAEMIKGQAIPKIGTPEHAAAAVAFFASDDASFITGQSLIVDGGAVRQ